MKPHQVYQQNRQFTLPRIDMILSLYDGVIHRLEQLPHVDSAQAQKLTTEVKMIVSGFAVGVVNPTDDMEANFLRLYEYVLHCLDTGKGHDAVQVMHTLREGFQAIRAQALELERNGTIPSLDRAHTLQAVG